MPADPDSHGTELRSCDLDGVRVSEVSMPRRLELDHHTHATAQIVFVLEGTYREKWKGRENRLGPGSAIFRPPGEPHENRFGDDEVLALVVAYEPGRLPGSSSFRDPAPLPTLLDDLRARIGLELSRQDAATAHALEGLALLLLARVERATRSREQPEWLREAIRIVESDHAEAISLTTVASRVGIHRSTLAAGFQRYLDRSVGETIRRLRVRSALDALQRSDRPLAEIALQCGFSDQSHMGRLVKHATGLTPGEIRAG